MEDDAVHTRLAGPTQSVEQTEPSTDPSTEPSTKPSTKPSTTPLAKRGRILLVDDEAVFAGALQRLLSHEYDVTLLTSGRDALDQVRAGARFDVILCDLVMPMVSGIELHAELRHIAPEQADRIIFLTGGAFTGRFQQFLDSIANCWFEKPCNLQELRAAIRRTVR
jgi:CheY-like chemotaxis protein